MPELPEVETTRRSLLTHMEGETVTCVTLYRKDLRWPITDGIASVMQGARVDRIRRRAKYMLFDMSSGATIIAHLGMSGSFRFERKGFHRRTHDHVVISMKNGTEVVYHDPRRFGALLWCKTQQEATHPLLAGLGPEPLSADFHADYLAEKLRNKMMPIKPTLMNQKLVVGVGNIYASESLFRARLHPALPANRVVGHAAALVGAIKSVLSDAIASGGSTLRDYVHGSGEMGYFQHAFDVYDKAGEPCKTCGVEIANMVQAQRATYYCPACQSKKNARKK
jgi:formamidopyrimidine-DNA glycosylase